MRYYIWVIFLCVVLLVSLIYPAQRVLAAAGPEAYWKFDDGSGTAPVDSSGNNITGAFTTVHPTWSTDVPSAITFSDPYSLDFTGNHDGVTFSWPSALNFGSTDPRSFSFWYKPVADGETDSGEYDRIISWSSDQFEIAGTTAGSSNHTISYYDGNWNSTSLTLTLGTWYHITFTYDGSTAKFYIGNDLKDSHSLGGRSLSGTMAIGTRASTNDEGINGRIDDVRVYNYALDSSQISNLTGGSNDPDSAPATPTPTPSPTSTPGPTSTPTNTPAPTVAASSSSSSTTSSSCVPATIHSTPNLYEVDTEQTSARLYFTPASGADGYTVSYGTTTSADQYAVSFGNGDQSGAVSYTVNGLQNGVTYYFKVKGTKSCSSSDWSSVVATAKKESSNSILSNVVHAFSPTKKIDVVKSQVSVVSPTPTSQLLARPTLTPAQPSGVSLDVKVLGADNKPVAGVSVTLHSKVQIAKTDTKGIAHFTNVEKGSHRVLLAYNGYTGEQRLSIDGSKKEQALTMQVKLTSGLAWGWVTVIVGVFAVIIGLLIWLLLKKRKKDQGFKQVSSKR
jgi:hypothetical protein